MTTKEIYFRLEDQLIAIDLDKKGNKIINLRVNGTPQIECTTNNSSWQEFIAEEPNDYLQGYQDAILDALESLLSIANNELEE